MKAVQLTGQGPVEEAHLGLVEVARPEPGPGQVLLRVRMCGVCHTDLHIVEGDLEPRRLPVVPGHQVVATVEASGPGVEEPAVGSRVGVPWLYSTCGRCRYCRGGRENLCREARFTGWDVDGGFAEWMVAPAGFVHPLPEGFADEHVAPLLCAGIIGYRALRLSGIRPGERLGLYGFGAAAHLAIQVARHWDCEVYVFTRSEHHRRQAERLGAAWVGGAEDDPPHQIQAGIVFAPAGWLVPQALRVLDRGATLVLGGIHMSPIPQMPYELLYHERVLRSVTNLTRRDAREFLDLAAEIPIRSEVEVFPLEEAREALRRVKDSQIEGAAVLRVG